MKYEFTTTNDDTARMLVQALDAHIALIRMETMLRNYRKADSINYEDLIANYFEVIDGIWLPE